MRGDFDALPRARRFKANAWEVVIYYKGVGCGNGRDSLYFASRGFDVVGADYSPPAVELCAARATEAGLGATFEELNIYDVVDVARFSAANEGGFDYLYARFFVHAITEQGEEDLLLVCQAVLKPGGRCYLEFRTNHDLRAQAGREISANEREDGHYRRFVDPDLLFVPLVIKALGGLELTFFSTLATFGTALDITLAELAIESFFPGDAATADALRQVAAT